MADLEDSLSPTWDNIMTSHKNLILTCSKKVNFYDGEQKKMYKLKRSTPTVIFLRIRSLHKKEAHVDGGGQAISATLFDLGVYLFHNHADLIQQQGGVYVTIPKIESMEEAEFFADLIQEAETYLGIKPQSVKVSVVFETLQSIIDIEEIVWALRKSIVSVNTGKWNYTFDIIKNF